MRELRLLPAALMVWAMTLMVLLGYFPVAVIVLLISATTFVLIKQFGQAILVSALGTIALLVAHFRMRWAPDEISVGTVTMTPTETSSGFLIRLKSHGSTYPVFVEKLPDGIETGSLVEVNARWSESKSPSVSGVVGNGEVVGFSPPTGLAGIAVRVSDNFREVVQATVGEASQGLIPGMVLGDTSLQDTSQQELFIETGLSHLSAVSGANVAIVLTAFFLLCRWIGLGPRVQVVSAGFALFGFVVLVGTEPSVLRASVAGVVGLLAVVNSSRAEPIHSLCIGVIGLIVWDSDMAASFGFALSSAATASIVVLTPMFHRLLAPLQWPDILARALAVAIAADFATMPIVALMAGEVSMVSVLVNVLVAPVTAPITILGLIAAGLAQLPFDTPAFLLLKLIEPCTWWIYHIAAGAHELPIAVIAASPIVVLLAYGWIVAGLVCGHPRKTFAAIAALLIVFGVNFQPRPQPLEITQVFTVNTDEEIDDIPAGTQAIIVLDGEGRKSSRGIQTPDGIPVFYPNRDGQVTVYTDGSQHAADGRF
ncbi:ComEC/Rec2 family competence protein [Corynebacterium casei]|uniref:ComEC/Rec2 family competence protein n=1 Tax=Corynebacterium casei TaxID=160386 RepID=UPI0026473CAE|nr:ComEC/Rec2 family competence protein [Corynebacterium casei]MDN5728835.1 ComEC/Rec2 family competence protein [Corynebacterium casei]